MYDAMTPILTEAGAPSDRGRGPLPDGVQLPRVLIRAKPASGVFRTVMPNRGDGRSQEGAGANKRHRVCTLPTDLMPSGRKGARHAARRCRVEGSFPAPTHSSLRRLRRVHAPGTAREGLPEDQAKGYGIWLAKVVASRRFGQKSSSDGKKPSTKDAHEEEPTFRSVGDELQTDETFDHDIIERMGARFYDAVFVPAISEARAEGKIVRDHPGHDPPRLETCPRGIAVRRRIDHASSYRRMGDLRDVLGLVSAGDPSAALIAG